MNIKEISRMSGVSVCTASRVLSGRASEFRSSEATAQHVLEVARKAHYRPNYLAHSLNTDRTYSIGLVFANTVDNYLGSIMEGVESHLRGTEYQTVVAPGENDIWTQAQAVRRMLHRHTDGIIFYPEALNTGETYDFPVPIGHRKQTTPIVIIGRTIPGTRDQVMMADREVGVATARYFLEAGCRRIAFITRPTNCSSDRNRQLGFIETLKAAGVPESHRIIIEEADGPSAENLRKLKHTEALFGVNSSLLLTFVQALRDRVDINKIKLVSVGAIEGECLMNLQLRTWSISSRKMGEEAARILLWRIDNPTAPWVEVTIPLQWTSPYPVKSR